MLHNYDRHANSRARRLRIGDRARFPLSNYDLHRTNQTHYNRDFEIIAFGGHTATRTPVTRYTGGGRRYTEYRLDRDDHTSQITIRRLHDGWTTTIGQRTWIYHADADDQRADWPNRSQRKRQGFTPAHATYTAYRRFIELRRQYNEAADRYCNDRSRENHAAMEHTRRRYYASECAYTAREHAAMTEVAAQRLARQIDQTITRQAA